MAEPIPTSRRDFPLLAPHLADAEVQHNKARLVHVLTLDASRRPTWNGWCGACRRPARTPISRADRGRPPHGRGDRPGRIPGYLDADRFGALDMTSAVRSPGSTLKPLIYGLAFEAGLAHPETLIEDRPVRFGAYVPKNFDQDWHGTVTVRMALAQSLNIPAVKVLDALGAG